ncbi:LysR family transcriptional regulator [Arthrobacter psychrolactophilus]|uniref:LysR family transcriptional regulator n=2 Tax=Arthrobacter psychrolactophilus TaxID=92442 RepID=A0A2V5ISK3_9MICC|nr:LysR family transcriptional regulator [Arthrobacter psychrolactophilus]
MGLMAQAETETRELGTGAAGQLNLGFFASAGLQLVPNALSRFIRERPSVSLNLIQGQPFELVPRLLSRELDVAVVFSYSTSPKAYQRPGGNPALRYEDLLHESHFLAVPPSYRPMRRGPVNISDLAEQPWIATQGMENEAALVDRLCATAGYSPRVRCRTDYYEVALGMVSADVGFALIPGMSLIPWSLAQTRGIRLSKLTTTHPAGRTIQIATRAGNPNPLVDAIVAQLRHSAIEVGQEIERLETAI